MSFTRDVTMYSASEQFPVPHGDHRQAVVMADKLPPGNWLLWAMLHASDAWGGSNYWLDPQPAGFIGNLGVSVFFPDNKASSLTVNSPVSAARTTEDTDLVFQVITRSPDRAVTGTLYVQGVKLG